jgi:hypothetical protein
MSKIKAPRFVWFIVGALVTVLLVPSAVALAKSTLKFTGIEGTSSNKADVTPAGQLLTTEANPASYFDSGTKEVSSGALLAIYTPPSGSAGILTNAHVDSWSLTGTDPFLGLYLTNATCTTNTFELDEVDPSANGVTDLPFGPGQVIPAGDTLCAGTAAMSANVTAIGYTIPAADAPTQPLVKSTPLLKH